MAWWSEWYTLDYRRRLFQKIIPTSLPPGPAGRRASGPALGGTWSNAEKDDGGGDLFCWNFYSPAEGLPPPAASLRVGRQQDLAREELETVQRMTGLEDTLKSNIHQHSVSQLPADSHRDGGGQLDLAPKELEAMMRLFIRLLFTCTGCSKLYCNNLLQVFYCNNFIAMILFQ